MFRFHPGKDVFELPQNGFQTRKFEWLEWSGMPFDGKGVSMWQRLCAPRQARRLSTRTAFSLLIQHPRGLVPPRMLR